MTSRLEVNFRGDSRTPAQWVAGHERMKEPPVCQDGHPLCSCSTEPGGPCSDRMRVQVEREKAFEPWTSGEFRRVREALGWSQNRVATLLGYNRSAVAKWEAGEVTPPLVVRLALQYVAGLHSRGPSE